MNKAIKKMYLRKVATHGGTKLWFYSAKDYKGAKFLGEFENIEEAVKATGRCFCGNTNN